jgi:hypothetical protein
MSSTSAGGKTPRYFSASAGDLQPMKRRHPSSMDRSTRGVFGSPIGVTAGPSFGACASHDTLAARGRMFDEPIGAPQTGSTTAVPSPKQAGPARGCGTAEYSRYQLTGCLLRRVDRYRLWEVGIYESDGAPEEKEGRPKHQPAGYQACMMAR